MSLPMLFVAGVRLQRFELEPQQPTKTLRGAPVAGYSHVACVHFKHGGYRMGLAEPSRDHSAHVITYGPRNNWTGMTHCTASEVVPLISVATHLFDSGAVGNKHRSNGSSETFTHWYTPAAGREHSSETINRYGTLLEITDFDEPPRVVDLFHSHDFWLLLRTVRENSADRTAIGVLADFVQERGFDQLAQALRSKRQSALRLLPAKSLAFVLQQAR